VNKPKSLNHSGIPGTINDLKNEWDSMVLETFELKKHLENVRKQLAHALYQHDAACRVISRLIQERDESRQQLQLTQEQLSDFKKNVGTHGLVTTNDENVANNAQSAPQADTSHAHEQESCGIYPGLVKRMEERSDELHQMRKSRKKPNDYFKVSELENLTETGSYPLHSSTDPGISCLDIYKGDSGHKYICTGGNDGTAIIFDNSTQKVVAKLSNPDTTKRVTGVQFSQSGVLVSKQDGVAEYWKVDFDSQSNGVLTTELAQSVQGYHGAVASLHPLNPYFVYGAKNDAWGMFNLETGVKLCEVPIDVDAHLSSIAVHPDGLMVATGYSNGIVNIWDVRSQQKAATREEHKSAVTSLKFSEKAIHLASASHKEPAAVIWNMKKPQNAPHKLAFGASSTIRSIDFDQYASYIVTAYDSNLSFSKVSDPETVISTIPAHKGAINQAMFAPDGSYLASVSEDRFLKTFAL
jgi:pre-mRNA-processing factor 19